MSHEQQHTYVPTAAHKKHRKKSVSTTSPTLTPTARFTTHKHVPSHVPSQVHHHTYTPSSAKFRTTPSVSQSDARTTLQFKEEDPSPPPIPSVVVNATYDFFPNATTNDDAVLPPPPPEQQLFATTSTLSTRSNNNLSGFIGVFAFMPVVLLGAWFLQGRVRRRWGYRHIPSVDEAVYDDEEMRRL